MRTSSDTQGLEGKWTEGSTKLNERMNEKGIYSFTGVGELKHLLYWLNEWMKKEYINFV